MKIGTGTEVLQGASRRDAAMRLATMTAVAETTGEGEVGTRELGRLSRQAGCPTSASKAVLHL